jgi:hypothetical protein
MMLRFRNSLSNGWVSTMSVCAASFQAMQSMSEAASRLPKALSSRAISVCCHSSSGDLHIML